MYHDKVREHHINQIVNIKVYGTEKQRSVKQMNTYWACCETVAKWVREYEGSKNKEYRRWNTKNKVDFQIKVELDFRDPEYIAVRPDGELQFKYLSISFKNLKHIEACNYFDQAFEEMARFIGCKKDVLIEMAKSNMKG